MKEVRYFFAPDAATSTELPNDEAMHALRVLRLKTGDELMLMDGKGNYYRAEVTLAHTKRCLYKRNRDCTVQILTVALIIFMRIYMDQYD